MHACVCESTPQKLAIEILWGLTANFSVFAPSGKILFSIHHHQHSRLALINAALHIFKSSDELLNTCGRCCSWHGHGGKLARRAAWARNFYWGQLLCCTALPAPAGWQARCTPPARRFPTEPPSPGASHAHLNFEPDTRKKKENVRNSWQHGVG